MPNFLYAIRFIKASFSLAFKNIRLQEQWVYLAIGNFVLLIIWFIPLASIIEWVGFGPWGISLIGFIFVLMLFSFNIWGEITRAPATREIDLVFKKDESSDEDVSKKKSFFAGWRDQLVLAMILPVIRISHIYHRLLFPEKETHYNWLEAQALLVPLIAVEGLNVQAAITRISAIIADKLLRFRSELIRVDLVAKLVQWVFCLIGILVGFSVAVLIVTPIVNDPYAPILGLGIGLLIAWIFITLGILFNTFSRSCYHMALYQWVVNVAEARQKDVPTKAAPPEILGDVLGKGY